MSGPSVPMPYQPTGQAQADTNYQSLFQSYQPYAQNLPGQVIPGIQSQVSSIVNSPYAAGYQNAANTAAGQAGTIAGQQLGGASALYGAGQQALAQGFDPQNALYNQQFQQLMDQQNAINSASGLAGSPYAAGISGQAARNFNLDWLNNQLNREGTASQIAGQDFTGASQLGAAGLDTTQQIGQIPYQVGNQIAGTNISAYGQQEQGVSGALAPSDQLMSDLGNYLGIGQQANQLAQQAEKQNYAQSNALASGFGSLLFGPYTNPFQTAGTGQGQGGGGGGGGGLFSSLGSTGSGGQNASGLLGLASTFGWI